MNSSNHPNYLDLDLSQARRVLVAGDVHGHLDLLTKALTAQGYDAKAGDRLILLGDLLDRGPDVLEIRDWLDANPGVITCLGNHEDMLMGTVLPEQCDEWANATNFFMNGGQWLRKHLRKDYKASGWQKLEFDLMCADDPGSIVADEIMVLARRFATHPVAVRALTPAGRSVGFVHADVVNHSWPGLVAEITHPDPRRRRRGVANAIWQRESFDGLKYAQRGGYVDHYDCTIADIDHVFFGHSITKEPLTHCNCSWIDTGSYKRKMITVLDVDEWLNRHDLNRILSSRALI